MSKEISLVTSLFVSFYLGLGHTHGVTPYIMSILFFIFVWLFSPFFLFRLVAGCHYSEVLYPSGQTLGTALVKGSVLLVFHYVPIFSKAKPLYEACRAAGQLLLKGKTPPVRCV